MEDVEYFFIRLLNGNFAISSFYLSLFLLDIKYIGQFHEDLLFVVEIGLMTSHILMPLSITEVQLCLCLEILTENRILT